MPKKLAKTFHIFVSIKWVNKLIKKVMNKKQSSPREATLASSVLLNPFSSEITKSLAGSVLSQSRGLIGVKIYKAMKGIK